MRKEFQVIEEGGSGGVLLKIEREQAKIPSVNPLAFLRCHVILHRETVVNKQLCSSG